MVNVTLAPSNYGIQLYVARYICIYTHTQSRDNDPPPTPPKGVYWSCYCVSPNQARPQRETMQVHLLGEFSQVAPHGAACSATLMPAWVVQISPQICLLKLANPKNQLFFPRRQHQKISTGVVIFLKYCNKTFCVCFMIMIHVLICM